MQSGNRTFSMVAQTLFGLEEVLAAELKELGASDIEAHNRAVSFSGNKALMYKANLHLRTALRVLLPIHSFVARDEEGLYKGIQQISWSKIFSADQTFAVQSVVKSEHFNHANYVALKTKDAIVDQFRDKWGKRPSVDKENPEVEIFIHVNKQEVKVMLNSSGESLHKRGYRAAQGIAPLNEVLAAGILLLTGWRGEKPFVDPMCGSGTLLTEALMIARNEAPGKYRKNFGFQGWSDYDKKTWNDIKASAAQSEHEATTRLFGFDKDVAAVTYSTKNLISLKAGDAVQLENRDFFRSEKCAEEGMLILNPPYDERLPVDDVNAFYKQIGDTLKKQWQGFEAWVFSANKEAMKNLGLQTSKRFTLYNGPHECKLHRYELYAGTRKAAKISDQE